MYAAFSAAVMGGWQVGEGGAKSDVAFGKRAGICHPCQHNGSEKGNPKMLPGNPYPPCFFVFLTGVDFQQLKTEFL